MPELPDVQVFEEYLDATSLHRRIRHVRVAAGRTTWLCPREQKRV